MRGAVEGLQYSKDAVSVITKRLAAESNEQQPVKKNGENFGTMRHRAKSYVDNLFGDQFGDEWDTFPAVCDDLDELLQFSQTVNKRSAGLAFGRGLPKDGSYDFKQICKGQALVTCNELLVRTRLAVFQMEYPELADNVFQTESLVELPASLQRFVAADILRGEKGSVILSGARRRSCPECQPTDKNERLMAYLADGNLPQGLHSVFTGVGMGVAAVNSAVCPLNRFGVCDRVAQRLEIGSELDDELDKEISQWYADAGRRKVSALKGFPRGFGKDPLKVNVKTHIVATDENGEADIARTVINILKPSAYAESDEKSPENHPFSTVVVLMHGRRFELDPRQEESAEAVIQEIIESGVFLKYMKKYKEHRLPDFFKQALRTILLSTQYPPGGVIRPYLAAKPVYVEGERTRVLRLSGRKLAKSCGAATGGNTRIMFAPVTKGDQRIVDIKGISHKSGLLKRRTPQKLFT